MTMLVAGHETTAAVLTWSTFLLATHPETMAEVQAEVDEVLGKTPGRPTFDDLKEMQKVRHVIAESLRLYPEPPILIRRALEKVELPQVRFATIRTHSRALPSAQFQTQQNIACPLSRGSVVSKTAMRSHLESGVVVVLLSLLLARDV